MPPRRRLQSLPRLRRRLPFLNLIWRTPCPPHRLWSSLLRHSQQWLPRHHLFWHALSVRLARPRKKVTLPSWVVANESMANLLPHPPHPCLPLRPLRHPLSHCNGRTLHQIPARQPERQQEQLPRAALHRLARRPHRLRPNCQPHIRSILPAIGWYMWLRVVFVTYMKLPRGITNACCVVRSFPSH
jgi:hypothetical protein